MQSVKFTDSSNIYSFCYINIIMLDTGAIFQYNSISRFIPFENKNYLDNTIILL
ncbi:MAG: hypothetical protein LBR79_02970 [Oscillospiraceae bacterium]|nr:hypothetical protein [Oscillospiraceae bacterium]